ncbi:MAG: hypothetical protein IJS50_00790 [Desulfovibrio sp.]|nr:hypothetical protein [Desulfovibrio sp.]
MENLILGAIIFDDPANPSQGWLAIAEEEARRFSKPGFIPYEAVYLTNISYELMKALRLKLPSNYLLSSYLYVDLKRLAARFRVVDRRFLAEVAAKLFSRVIALCRVLFQEEDFLPNNSLGLGLNSKLGLSDALVEEEVAAHLREATRYLTFVSSAFGAKKEQGIFLVPPREHCLAILEQALPYSPFVKLEPLSESWSKLSRPEVLAKLDELVARASLVALQVRGAKESSGDLLGLTSLRRAKLASRLFWLPAARAQLLANYAHVILHQVLGPRSNLHFSFPTQLAKSFPKESSLSLTADLFFANLWRAMSLLRRGTGKKSNHGLVYVNPLRPYLYACDQNLLWPKVLKISQLGFEVQSYGLGGIRLALDQKSPQALYDLALETGLIPPALLDDKQASQLPKPKDYFAYLQYYSALGDLAKLLDWDKKILDLILTYLKKNKTCLAEEDDKKNKPETREALNCKLAASEATFKESPAEVRPNLAKAKRAKGDQQASPLEDAALGAAENAETNVDLNKPKENLKCRAKALVSYEAKGAKLSQALSLNRAKEGLANLGSRGLGQAEPKGQSTFSSKLKLGDEE